MVNEIPIFITCAVCKRAKPKKKVTHDAVVDEEKVRICGQCLRVHAKSLSSKDKRQLLQE